MVRQSMIPQQPTNAAVAAAQPQQTPEGAPFPMPTSRPSLAMPGRMPDLPKDGSAPVAQQCAPETVQASVPAPSGLLADLAHFRQASKPNIVSDMSLKALLLRGLIIKGSKYYVVSKKGLQYLEDFVLPA